MRTVVATVSLTMVILFSCTEPIGPGPDPVLGTEFNLLSFAFLQQDNPALGKDVLASINSRTRVVTAVIPAGCVKTALVASFTTSNGSIVKVGGVEQVTGVTSNNFSSSVVYAVWAEDEHDWGGYSVQVSIDTLAIDSFRVLNGAIPGGIDCVVGANDINGSIPYSDQAALASPLTVEITHGGTTVTQGGLDVLSGTSSYTFTDGVAKDFVVVSGTGATKTYPVTLSVAAPSSSCDVTTFWVNAGGSTYYASITGTSIQLTIPSAARSSVTVHFTLSHSWATAAYNSTALVSGTSVLDLSGTPDQIVVTAENGTSSKTYTFSLSEPSTTVNLRIAAANTSSGNYQDYTNGEGIRMLQGVHPDVVLIQEFNYKSDSEADFQEMANLVIYGSTTGGSTGEQAYWYREGKGGVGSASTIPNGIISRYPFVSYGEWDDTYMTDRDFAWARIDIPGSKDLWVVSLHIKASSGSSDKEKRANEATLLKSYISANVPSGDYLAVGGDFNTYANDTVNEPCLGVFDDFVTLPANHPRDQGDDGDTNSGRSSPYDRVLVDNDLSACATATIIGAHSFTYGLVLDTRVTSPYSIVADVSPALVTDSAALNMQHMTVVRDFTIPTT